MTSAIKYLPLVILAVIFNVVAQILLKMGAKTIGQLEMSLSNVCSLIYLTAASPAIVGGISIYIFSVAIWILLLSRLEVSYAYPLTSLGYIFTALAGNIFLQETLSPVRIFGILMIVLGAYCVACSTA